MTAGAAKRTSTRRAAPRSQDVDDLIELSRLLVSVAHRSLQASRDEVALPQFRALMALSRCGPCTAGALASSLDLAPSTTTRLCDKLVAAGWVTRDTRPSNRREVELALTAAGRRVVDQVLAARSAELETVLGQLRPTARRTLATLLPELLTAADQVGGDPRSAWAV